MNELKLKAELYNHIEAFINKTANKQSLDGYFYNPEIGSAMTEAAFLVLKATIENQQHYQQEHE